MTNTNERMPVLFVGHGSPMNAIENNEYTKGWEMIAREIPRPRAILSISAHWYTNGSKITDAANPKMIYDMYGFPDELYQVVYKAVGAPELAQLTKTLIEKEVQIDNTWGCDHGTWSVLSKMYPEGDIPTFQLSIDADAKPESHFKIGQQISSLREKGVLIFGSGNIVHNLARINWNMKGGYPWAVDFDGYIRDKILRNQFEDVVNYKMAGESSKSAFNTPDHFCPLLYVLGAVKEDDQVSIFNEACMLGAMSMTSYLFE
ncbi:4,5-DOPA dioxygenase extradiol [Acetobacterium bakii]|nr:4,5-DOPA dioxygenase extradiol [Acetobacterium bakii]